MIAIMGQPCHFIKGRGGALSKFVIPQYVQYGVHSAIVPAYIFGLMTIGSNPLFTYQLQKQSFKNTAAKGGISSI